MLMLSDNGIQSWINIFKWNFYILLITEDSIYKYFITGISISFQNVNSSGLSVVGAAVMCRMVGVYVLVLVSSV